MTRSCSIAGCDHPHRAKGYCGTHYLPFKAEQNLREGRICGLPECDRPQYAKGYCRAHYRQQAEGREVGAIRPTFSPVQDEAGNFRCRNCMEFKPADAFAGRNRTQCRSCQGTLWRYGLDAQSVRRLLASQGGGCAICGTESPGGRWKRWHVDHDHSCCPGTKSCGACVKAVLCNNCNMGVGFFGDDPDRLLSASEYVRRTRAR